MDFEYTFRYLPTHSTAEAAGCGGKARRRGCPPPDRREREEA